MTVSSARSPLLRQLRVLQLNGADGPKAEIWHDQPGNEGNGSDDGPRRRAGGVSLQPAGSAS